MDYIETLPKVDKRNDFDYDNMIWKKKKLFNEINKDSNNDDSSETEDLLKISVTDNFMFDNHLENYQIESANKKLDSLTFIIDAAVRKLIISDMVEFNMKKKTALRLNDDLEKLKMKLAGLEVVIKQYITQKSNKKLRTKPNDWLIQTKLELIIIKDRIELKANQLKTIDLPDLDMVDYYRKNKLKDVAVLVKSDCLLVGLNSASNPLKIKMVMGFLCNCLKKSKNENDVCSKLFHMFFKSSKEIGSKTNSSETETITSHNSEFQENLEKELHKMMN